MKIAFESNLSVPSVAEAIAMLTDRAKICIDDIHYDEARRIVEIYLQRREVTGFEKSLLGEMQPVYGETMIQSSLTIRQVEEMTIQVDDRLGESFTLLLGVKVDENELYLGSAEEISGKHLCSICIKVKGLNLEFSDDVKA